MLSLRLLTVGVLTGCLFAACGGTGNYDSATPTATATPTAKETIVPVNSTGTLSIALNTGGFSGTFELAEVSSDVTSGLEVDLTQSTTLPSGFPALQSAARQLRAAATQSSVTLLPLFYFVPIFSAAVTGTSGSVTLTIPPSDIASFYTYYVALFDPSATSPEWQLQWAGPASVSGDTLTLRHALPITLNGRTTYAIAVYAVANTVPTPAPSASPLVTASPTSLPTSLPAPTPTPLPSVSVAPSPGVFAVSPTSVPLTGPGAEQQVYVTEPNFSGLFMQTNSCGGEVPIATINAVNAQGPSWSPLVVAQNPGNCSAVFSDGSGRQVTVMISVGNNGFTIDAKRTKGK